MAAPVHLETRGSGPPVLLLHGWGANLRVFDALGDGLARTHRVVAADLPGHGRSAYDTASADFGAQTALLAERLPADTVVIGWSLGGQHALALAHRAPTRVRGLVLLASTPRFVAAPDWPHGVAPALLDTFAAQLARDWHGTLEEFLALQVRGDRHARAVLEALLASLREHGEPDPVALAAGLRHLRDNDLRALVPDISAPTLVIAGQHDRVTPPAAGGWLAADLPRGRYAELPRAGHAPFLSHADETLALVQGFLAELPT